MKDCLKSSFYCLFIAQLTSSFPSAFKPLISPHSETSVSHPSCFLLFDKEFRLQMNFLCGLVNQNAGPFVPRIRKATKKLHNSAQIRISSNKMNPMANPWLCHALSVSFAGSFLLILLTILPSHTHQSRSRYVHVKRTHMLSHLAMKLSRSLMLIAFSSA